jgi:4-hydroxy-tetrahydrodipicolinate reductase
MGDALAQLVLADPELQLNAAIVRPGNPLVGSKFKDTGVIISDTLNNADLELVIDFTLPSGVMTHLGYCLQHKIPMVIGSTGFDKQQLETINAAARDIPIVQAYNMSIGVNKFYKLVQLAAQTFDDSWGIEIHDVHHQHKKDIPSGTAKELARIISKASNRNIDDIKILSERRGETIGVHAVVFSTSDESISLFHNATTRDIFAKGALVAAKWLVLQQPGLYSMQNVV